MSGRSRANAGRDARGTHLAPSTFAVLMVSDYADNVTVLDKDSDDARFALMRRVNDPARRTSRTPS